MSGRAKTGVRRRPVGRRQRRRACAAGERSAPPPSPPRARASRSCFSWSIALVVRRRARRRRGQSRRSTTRSSGRHAVVYRRTHVRHTPRPARRSCSRSSAPITFAGADLQPGDELLLPAQLTAQRTRSVRSAPAASQPGCEARARGRVVYCGRRDVAQSGSAPALGAGGRRFKSARPDQARSQRRE